ncbi:MAG TPA: hypothetical protein VIK18_13955 [Pirellulales bacterium]
MTSMMRSDSAGNVYEVWAQEQAASCAVASIWMARNQALQMTLNQGEWALAWQMYGQVVQGMALIPSPPAGQCLDPSAYKSDQKSFGDMFAKFGTYMDQVATKLALDGLSVTSSVGTMVDVSQLSDTSPAIILLGWYSGGKRVGGHFIVASSVTQSGKVVYLDPWGGNLNELGVGPAYPGGGQFEDIRFVSASD